jgi:hypothetical protein
VGRTIGGERVLVMARLDGIDIPDEDQEAEREGLKGVAYMCDLVPGEDCGVSMRRVVMRAVDVLAGERFATPAVLASAVGS